MNLILLAISAVALINIIVSVMVLRVVALSPKQRFLQISLIWVAPLIGAAICAAFVSSQGLGPASGTVDPLYLPGDGGHPPESGANV